MFLHKYDHRFSHYETGELVQEIKHQQDSLMVENEFLLAWRSKSKVRRQLIDHALSQLKKRFRASDTRAAVVALRKSKAK